MEGRGGGETTTSERQIPTKPAGKVRVLMFASARELAGVSEAILEIQPGWTTSQCFEDILVKFPALQSISSCLVVALNQNYVTEPAVVKDGDELALIPPISGG